MDNMFFLLFSGESVGCYRCDTHYGLKADIYESLEQVVNIFHDMMEKKIVNDYPAALYLFDRDDGEIMENLDLDIDAGCIGGLYEISFKFNNMIYKIRKGKRKKMDGGSERND